MARAHALAPVPLPLLLQPWARAYALAPPPTPMPTLSPPQRQWFVTAQVRDLANPLEAQVCRIALSELRPSPLGGQRCFLEERRAFAKVMSEKGIDPMDEMRAR